MLPIAYGVLVSNMVSDVPNSRVLATIARNGSGEFVEKRSRFLCTLRRVETMDEAQNFVAEMRQLHWDARHHCTAIILGPDGHTQRSNDDGEPAGTAGAPMLAVLQAAKVSDVAAVVTRWFGGVLLGTGGLVRAYSHAVQVALENVGTLKRQYMQVVTLEVAASEVGKVENVLRQWLDQHHGTLGGVDYGERALLRAHIPPPELEKFMQWCQQFGITDIAHGDAIISDLR